MQVVSTLIEEIFFGYFRFDIVEVLSCLLKHTHILVNEPTIQGSTPVMVAIKYGNMEVLKIMLRDERVDLGRRDRSGRSLSELVGVANSCCADDVKQKIVESIRAETNKRESAKKKKMTLAKSKTSHIFYIISFNALSDIAPRLFIANQAREKVRKLVEEMDETQTLELMRFKENMENNSKEFNYKQQTELETFLGNLKENWESFLAEQENERNEFLAKLDMRRSVFLATQKETQEEFFANEEYLQIKFQEKQFDEFSSLQMREECKSLTARKSISSCPTWDSQWGYLSGNINQLQSKARREKEESSRRNSAPVSTNYWSPVSDAGYSYLTCPPEVPDRKMCRQSSIIINNQTPSPVPSLEYVSQNIKKGKEGPPEIIQPSSQEGEISIRQTRPMIRTPKLSRKNTLDILKEEEERDQTYRDDAEILAITRNGFSSIIHKNNY